MEMVPLDRRGGSVPSSCGLTARHSAVKMLCMSAAKGKIIPPRSAVRPGAWLVPLLLALAVFVASPVLAKMPHAPRGRTGENALAGTAAVTGGGSVFNAPALQNPGTVDFSGDPYDFQYENLSQSPGASEGAYFGTGLMFAGGPLTAGSAALRSVYTAAAGVYGAVQGSTSAVNAVNDFQSGNTLGGSLNAAFAALNFGGVGFSAAYPAQSITGHVDNTGNLVDALASFAPVSAVPRTVSLNVLNPEFTPTAAVTSTGTVGALEDWSNVDYAARYAARDNAWETDNAINFHGNSINSPRTAYLYRLETKGGQFLKWGITQNPATRYSKAFMADKNMIPWASGPRSNMLLMERGFVETQPGPLNFEPWAGSRLGGQP